MTQSLDFQTPLDNRPLIGWTPFWRAVVFVLSAMSIWCLLVDFYSIVSMRVFTLYVFVPAAIVLVALAASDGFVGTKTLLRNVIIGAIAGFVAALSYDVFRLPFVFARQWHIASVVPPMPLFKVFPAFGQMILGHRLDAGIITLADQLVGWTYHFSNGITFGIMYMAMIGDATKRSWWWGVLMAVGIEIALLCSPYTRMFGIPLSAEFAVVTLSAHMIFGVVMGLGCRELSRRAAAA
jgi:hypothetical protein